MREAKGRLQRLRAKSSTVTTGNKHTMLKHYQCFSRPLKKDENLANIERLALVLTVQAIAGNKGECLRCNTIKSERDRVRVEVKIYCPDCGVTHVWHIGIGQLLLIGTRVVGGGDILLLAQGFGEVSHLCKKNWCIQPSNLFWEDSLINNERKLLYGAWGNWLYSRGDVHSKGRCKSNENLSANVFYLEAECRGEDS